MTGRRIAKILVDARVGWGAGIGRYVTHVVPRVAALAPDWQLDVLVPKTELDAASVVFGIHANTRVLTSDILPFSLTEQLSLAKLAQGYDLTWFTNYWVPLNWRGPFVAVVHDLIHLEADLFPASRIQRALAAQTFAKLRRDARAVMFVSRFSQRVFERRFGVPAQGAVVHLGSDHDAWIPFDPDHPPLKQRRILVVAASKMHKNFRMVIDAWLRARVGPQWRLTIVTPDLTLRSSIDVAGMANAGDGVELREGISNTELRDLYGESAIVLTPSLYEGFGLSLLEGLRSGAICISSAAEAMVEIAGGAFVAFVNGRDLTGWIEAIERACESWDCGAINISQQVAHNMRLAATFTWDRSSAETTAVIDAALL